MATVEAIVTNRGGNGKTDVIDVTALFGTTRRPCEETDRAIVEALERHGSFVAVGAWPDAEPWDGWRDAMMAMLMSQRGIAMTFLAAVSRGLDLEEDALLVPARGRNATLRLLHSTTEGASAVDTVITDSHVDTGILSMIWQDRIGGLQMQGPDGTWRDTPVVTDGLSVHCGDLVKTPSGDRIRGTPHRVMGTDDTERCSLGFFLEPAFETRVVPPSGVAVSYARHLVNEFPDRFKRPANAA